MAKNVPSLVGERFGRWIVLDKAEKDKSGEIRYLCRCECGNERIIRRTSLTTGNSKSCGCLSRDVAVKSNTKHGDTDKRLYRIWAGIIQRCCNNRSRYEWEKYGGRGICVCDEWKQYEAFRDWSLKNGYNDNLSIDRIDPDGNYCPENCRWATSYQQANNKRTSKFITFNGKTATVKEFADEYGIAYSCLYARLRNGWSVENALITPAKQIKKMTNAQKIRAMTDEQLAEFIRRMVDGSNTHEVACYGCIHYGTHHSDPENKGTDLYECDGCRSEGIGLDVLKWLRLPVREAHKGEGGGDNA